MLHPFSQTDTNWDVLSKSLSYRFPVGVIQIPENDLGALGMEIFHNSFSNAACSAKSLARKSLSDTCHYDNFVFECV